MRRSLKRAVAALGVATALLGPAAHAESAHAATPVHSGHAFVPPRLPTSAEIQLFAQRSPPLILQLTPAAPRAAEAVLRAAGAQPIGPQLRIWRLGGPRSAKAIARVRRLHALRAVEPDRTLQARPALATWAPTDPLSAQQWWEPAIGANAVVPPSAGVPVTDVDTGLDFSHPEFAGRPNTVALNAQTTTGDEDEAHGTAVASVIAAPENGLGIVGVYPQADLQAFDASPDELLDHGSIINGVLAAASRHAGVINLSLGGTSRDFIFQEAIAAAFGEGSLVIASAGNAGENGPVLYPASYPHVLTVAATTEGDAPTAFSSSSNAVDLAAPGQHMPVAVPLWLSPSGYIQADGTSFAAPLVSGAAAWVWTARPTLDVTQLFELMRRSARDVWRPGWDKDTGFGVLDIPNALSFPAPAVDPQEPNDDVYLVKPNGLFRDGTAFILGGGRRSTSFGARLDATEDPEDVFRVAIPPHSRLRVQVSASARTSLELWGPKTRTVYEKGAAKRRDLLAARGPSRKPRVTATNSSGKTRVAYVDAYLGKGVFDGTYSLRASLSRYSSSR